MKTTLYRELGRSGIQVSALGMGCWAIGGPSWAGETPVGWGKVDDEESIGAVHRALELGVNFFDTADVYGTGALADMADFPSLHSPDRPGQRPERSRAGCL